MYKAMSLYYKVRAVKVYKKDDEGNVTAEIDTVSPIISMPFVGVPDPQNEWYFLKTAIELSENEDVISIPEDRLVEAATEYKLLVEDVKSWHL